MRAKAKAYLVMVGVFVAGVAVGAGASFAVAQRQLARLVGEPGHEAMRERRLAALTAELELSATQRDQIRAIMDEHGDEFEGAMRDMFERCGDKLREERSKIDAEIKALLDPEQRRKFDELSELHRRRFLGAPRK